MNYRREVDGLRALAVIPVMLFHAGFPSFSGGFVGVDIFFVISGYLITSIIVAEQRVGTFTLLNFWERRARRILPALFLVMAVCVPLAWLWLPPPDMKGFAQSLVAVAVYASNVLFWKTSGYFDGAAELKPLLHTWSLAVEEQYYLLFPPLLVMARGLAGRWVLVILAFAFLLSLAAAQRWVATEPSAAFYLLPTRVWELLIGVFVALHFSDDRRWQPPQAVAEVGGALGLVLVSYAVLAFDKHTPFPSVHALVPTLGAALIILTASPRTVVGRCLSHRLLVGVGLVSYSAYLWHQPLFAFARHRTLGEPSSSVYVVLIIASLALAYFSWRYVEAPFRNRQRFRGAQILVFALTASMIFLGIGLLGHRSDGFVSRTPPGHLPADYFRQITATKFSNNGLDGRACTSETASLCKVSDQPGAKKVLLVGDSHSGDFSVEFRRLVADRTLTAWQMSVGGCGFLPSHRDRHNGECGKAIDLLHKALATEAFDVVIFIGDYYGHAREMAAPTVRTNLAALSELVSRMANSAGEVWLFTPRHAVSVQPIRAAMLNRLQSTRILQEPWQQLVDEGFQRMLIHPNVRLFNQRDSLIEFGGAGVDGFHGHMPDKEPLYRDTSHLTNLGARHVFDQFRIVSRLN